MMSLSSGSTVSSEKTGSQSSTEMVLAMYSLLCYDMVPAVESYMITIFLMLTAIFVWQN